jgi:saxitoxin biosynthesis operon SxtJ-like protein
VPTVNHRWHERTIEEPPSGSSNRSFGLMFATIFGVLSLAALWRGRDSALWWMISGFVFLVLALAAPRLLGPLNRAWRQMSLAISKRVNPVMMAIIFFGVLTPIGLLLRLLGKDLLHLRFEPHRPSYWVDRSSESARPGSMTNQF